MSEPIEAKSVAINFTDLDFIEQLRISLTPPKLEEKQRFRSWAANIYDMSIEQAIEEYKKVLEKRSSLSGSERSYLGIIFRNAIVSTLQNRQKKQELTNSVELSNI